MNLDSDSGKAVKISIAGHLALVVIVVIWSLLSTAFTPKVPEQHVFRLQGVRSQSMTGSRKPQAAAQASHSQNLSIPQLDHRAPAPEAVTAPSQQKPAVKPTPAPAKPKPKPKTAAKPAKPAKPMSYAQFQAQQKKPSKKPAAASSASSSQSSKKASSVPRIDASSVVSDLKNNLANSNEPLAAGTPDGIDMEGGYADRVRSLIDANFDEPSRVPHQVEAQVRFTITATGIVTGVTLVKSSGSGPFDSAALAAVRSLGQVEPPPGNRAVSFTIPFIATRDAE
ncbi:MAG TPA: energy transducer TonB [Opitutales bacterium]|nr:energy transducer TonB [Opitutales bacterium]